MGASAHTSRSRPRTSSAVQRASATVGSALIKTVRARHESLSSGYVVIGCLYLFIRIEWCVFKRVVTKY